MFTIYNLFKYLHIIAVIVWIGATFTLTLLNGRIAAAGDRQALMTLSRHSGFIGRAVVAPAATTTLITGVVMVLNSSLRFSMLWITWGLGGIFVSGLVIGAMFMRRTGQELLKLAPTASSDDPRVAQLQRRLAILNIINLLVLLSVEAAMVFRPV